MATYTSTVDPNGGKDYSSLSAWEAAVQDDHSSGDIELAVCYRTGATKDTAALAIAGWTDGVIPKVTVHADHKHQGKWADTQSGGNYIYVISRTTDWSTNVTTAIDATEIHDLLSESNKTNQTNFSIGSCNSVIYHNCIAKGGGTGFAYGTYGKGSHHLRNCMAWLCGKGISDNRGDNASARYCRAENCTIYDGVTGIHTGYGTIINNCISMSNSTADFTSSNSFAPGGNNNASSDTTAIGATKAVSKTSYTDYFVSESTGDLHLKGTSASLLCAGSDLSARFTDDIDGTTRSTWDIGYDEYVTAGSPSSSMSPSSSQSPSISPSSSNSPSVSPSASPSPGFEDYTRGDYVALPSNDNDLEVNYSAQDVIDVATKDNVRVAQTATQQFMIHEFKDYTGENASCHLEWEGMTTLAPSSSTVYLQIYNRNTSTWDTVDSDNTSAPDTDFILEGNVADLTNYKDGNTIISCRVYQEAL